MANTSTLYGDDIIMKALLSRNFSFVGGEYEDDSLTTLIRNFAFEGATNLSRLNLPYLTVVSTCCFLNTSIANLVLPWASITEVGPDSFRAGLGSKTSLTLSACTSVGDGAFSYNASLQSISLPAWTGTIKTDSRYTTTAGGIFRNCTGLTTVNLPEVLTLPGNTFRGCTSLETITLPKITSLAGNTFNQCTGLRKIRLQSAGFSSITGGPFNGCTNLEAVIFSGITEVPTISTVAFNSSGIASGNGYIYVPAALVDAVKAATNWSSYQDIIRACEDYPSIVN